MFAATLSEVYPSLNSEKPYLINDLGCETLVMIWLILIIF